MARTFDIDAPLLIAGHPVVAADPDVLRDWVKQRRKGWRNKERPRWRGVLPAEVLEIAAAPDRLLVRTEHGQGWLDVRGDSDAATVGTWILVDPASLTLIDAELPWMDARHDAALDPNQRAIVDTVTEHAGHRIIRATWTTSSGLRVRTIVDEDVADVRDQSLVTGSEIGPLVLIAGRPHVARQALA